MQSEPRSLVEAVPEGSGRSEEPAPTCWWLWAPGRQAHFRSISDDISSFISLVTPAGELETANRHMLNYFDSTLEELRARGITHSVYPEDLPNVVSAWKRTIATGQPYAVENRRRRSDGVYRWFDSHGFPLRDLEGRIV